MITEKELLEIAWKMYYVKIALMGLMKWKEMEKSIAVNLVEPWMETTLAKMERNIK